jgi:hypothetical protein
MAAAMIAMARRERLRDAGFGSVASSVSSGDVASGESLLGSASGGGSVISGLLVS